MRAPDHLIERVHAGERGAIARAITLIENGEGDDLAAALFPHTGGTATVGLTGAPGAGKSTLTDGLIACARREGIAVGVLAVDPTSPFTGGAILGDRVRMQDHATDPGVYIRSMATRGHLGGLALATPQAVRVLDAAGYPWVFIETVGVGQAEVEVAAEADTTVVVVAPGMGDGVQANKAGLMEIADLYVVNKIDRAGADDTMRDLETMLDLAEAHPWRPRVLGTVATSGAGVEELWRALHAHHTWLVESGELLQRRAERLRSEVRRAVTAAIEADVRARCDGRAFDVVLARVEARELAPEEAAAELVRG